MTFSPPYFAFAARTAMASASTRGSSSASAFRGASQPASEDRGAPRGVTRTAGAAASSSTTLPGRVESNASAAQPGPPTKQQRLTAIATGISSLQGDADTNSSAAQPGAAAIAVKPPPLAARTEHTQRSILQCGSSADAHARASSSAASGDETPLQTLLPSILGWVLSHAVGWSKRDHFGHCGYNCECCRAMNNCFMGWCDICADRSEAIGVAGDWAVAVRRLPMTQPASLSSSLSYSSSSLRMRTRMRMRMRMR